MLRQLFLVLLLASAFVNAADAPKSAVFSREHIKSVSVVAPEWEGFTNADGTGLYWEVLKAIYEPVGVKVKTANVPWNRAMKMVTRYRVYNAIAGEYKDSEEDLIFPDYALDVEYLSVLTLKNRHLPWQGLADLSGKRVGWIKDYDVLPPEQRDFELLEYRTTADGIALLEEGRIDYLIDEWDEIAAAVAAAKGDMTRYEMREMPEGTDIFLGFANTPLSEELIRIYNERLPLIYRDQSLQAIYQRHDGELPDSLRTQLATPE